ncbi:MAG: vWA domain-containing protein [Gammaproteobacteria bacterium]
MKTLIQRIVNRYRSHRLGLLLFAGFSLATVIALPLAQDALSLPEPKPLPQGEVQISVKPSQSKFVQGGQNTVYLDVTIKTPTTDANHAPQRATDMIIVLDRSGSMSGAEKMPFAKAAIRDVLARLEAQDRFALLSFSDNAVLHTPLTEVKTAVRENLHAIVDGIAAGGGTNIGDGLRAAQSLLSGSAGERARKVLLLSDGQANQGVTQPEALARLAAQITESGAVLSTVGMGLDFNETLMTQLADHGMGHYAYLEDLSGLSRILNRDLAETRQLFAGGSVLHVSLGDGVKLLDAGGYPVTQDSAATLAIATGQLLAGSDKHFVLTLAVATEKLGTRALGEMHLRYQQQDRQYTAPVDSAPLRLTVVAPERRREALGSIDRDVYRQSWLQNNLGLMQKKLSRWVREGKKELADQTINEYRQAVQAAEAESDVPLASPAVSGKLDDMRAKVEEAFAGSRDEQALKQKRAAKSMQFDALKEQRSR